MRLDLDPGSVRSKPPRPRSLENPDASVDQPLAEPQCQARGLYRGRHRVVRATSKQRRVAAPTNLGRALTEACLGHAELGGRIDCGARRVIVRRRGRDLEVPRAPVPGVDALLAAPLADSLDRDLTGPRDLHARLGPEPLAKARETDPHRVDK